MPLEFRPKYEKIVELLLYLAKTRPGADKYQAVKFFYLADREHFLRYGRPITQELYVAMKYGPVASTVKDLLEGNKWAFRNVGIDELPVDTELVDRPGNTPLLHIRSAKREPDFDIFSKSDIKVFDEVIAQYGDKNFNELYNITHKHFAYKRAWNDRGGSGSSPMLYEEMIESKEDRERFIEEIGPVAAHF